jgi:hypothetical protein
MAIGINGDSNEVDFQPQSSLLSKELDQPSYTESEALADAEELERLRNQTVCRHPKCGLRALTSGQPSPVKTEPCYDSWDSAEIMLLFKNSGIMKIRDFGYPPDDPRHGGDTVLLSRSEDDTRNARNAISLATPPPTPASSGVMAPTTFPTHRFIAPENLPNTQTPKKSRVIGPATILTPPPTPESSRIIKPLPRRPTRTLVHSFFPIFIYF